MQNFNSEDGFSIIDLESDGVVQQNEIKANFNQKDNNGNTLMLKILLLLIIIISPTKLYIRLLP